MGHIFWNERIKLIDSGENGRRARHRRLVVPLPVQQPDHAVACGAGSPDDLRDRRERRAGGRIVDRGLARELSRDAQRLSDDPPRRDQRRRQRLRRHRRPRRPRSWRADCSGAAAADACFRAGQPDGVFATSERLSGAVVRGGRRAPRRRPVLVHNYDYAIPDGRTLPGLRSWLKLPMDNCSGSARRGAADGVRRDIVRGLIDHFTLCLDGLVTAPAAPGAPAVDLVWSAGTLADSAWANELHPRSSGFGKLVDDCWSGPARHALGLS